MGLKQFTNFARHSTNNKPLIFRQKSRIHIRDLNINQ